MKNTLREDVALGAFQGLSSGVAVLVITSCAFGDFLVELVFATFIAAPLSGMIAAVFGRHRGAVSGGAIGAGTIGMMILLLNLAYLSTQVDYLFIEADRRGEALLFLVVSIVIYSFIGGLLAGVLRLLRVDHVTSASFAAPIGGILPSFFTVFLILLLMNPNSHLHL